MEKHILNLTLSSDIEANMKKINNTARIKAVSVYIWYDLLKFWNLLIHYSIK